MHIRTYIQCNSESNRHFYPCISSDILYDCKLGARGQSDRDTILSCMSTHKHTQYFIIVQNTFSAAHNWANFLKAPSPITCGHTHTPQELQSMHNHHYAWIDIEDDIICAHSKHMATIQMEIKIIGFFFFWGYGRWGFLWGKHVERWMEIQGGEHFEVNLHY